MKQAKGKILAQVQNQISVNVSSLQLSQGATDDEESYSATKGGTSPKQGPNSHIPFHLITHWRK